MPNQPGRSKGSNRGPWRHPDGQDLRPLVSRFRRQAIALALDDAGLAKINVGGLRPPATALW